MKLVALALLLAGSAFAQGLGGNPIEDMVNRVFIMLQGPVTRMAIVCAWIIAGLFMGLGSPEAKRRFGNVVGGSCIALGAVSLVSWLY